ncbi:MAG TPA: type II toxin-antitoxin system PemK/MazF family toxin [Acetobacteraceae bacterium]
MSTTRPATRPVTEDTWPSDDAIIAAGWVRRSRRDRLIISRPRVGQYFWVDFPHDAYAPEFVGEHPGIVVRAARDLHDTCIIVPLTSRPQGGARHAHRLARNPNPRGHGEGITAWAVCDHLYTVHLARLRPIHDRYGRPAYPTADHADLLAIFSAIRGALHRVFEPGPQMPIDPEPSRALGPHTLTLPTQVK